MDVVRVVREYGCFTVCEAVAAGGRRVALKTVCRRAAEGHVARLERERAVLESLEGCGGAAARLHGAGANGRVHWIATRWVPGVRPADLHSRARHLLRTESDPAADLFAATAEAVTAAVAAVHGRAVVHGDVSMGNVLLTPEGTAVIIDFGSARLPHHPPTAATPIAWRTTRPFTPPERLHAEGGAGAGGGPTFASDQYSLAAVLHGLLTGRARAAAAGAPDGGPDGVTGSVTHDGPGSVTGDGPDLGWAARRRPDLPAVLARALRAAPARRKRRVPLPPTARPFWRQP
ncbi:protein kinase domain-containing protein [Streptomyces sp. URMC 126]|uniref:protein kinase domain-containing protein n=1 Tax=Streptomyces sp. URMC 126 TaxID=3423401 RepID=UPI003F1AAE2F